VIVQFERRKRVVSIGASAKGYAAIWLKRNPWTSRARRLRVEHERMAFEITDANGEVDRSICRSPHRL
jgi:hypothetical protein